MFCEKAPKIQIKLDCNWIWNCGELLNDRLLQIISDVVNLMEGLSHDSFVNIISDTVKLEKERILMEWLETFGEKAMAEIKSNYDDNDSAWILDTFSDEYRDDEL